MDFYPNASCVRKNSSGQSGVHPSYLSVSTVCEFCSKQGFTVQGFIQDFELRGGGGGDRMLAGG